MDVRHSQLRIIMHYVTSLKYIHILNFVTSSTLVAIVTYDVVRLVQSQGVIIFSAFCVNYNQHIYNLCLLQLPYWNRANTLKTGHLKILRKNPTFQLCVVCHFFLNLLIMRRCELIGNIWCYMKGLMPKLIFKTDNDKI